MVFIINVISYQSKDVNVSLMSKQPIWPLLINKNENEIYNK